MTWRDLLQVPGETVVSPWIGGRSLQIGSRTWHLDGELPEEHGWFSFGISGRKAKIVGPSELRTNLNQLIRGYVVGNRIVLDDARVDPDPSKITEYSERVHLIEQGLDRFVRISAGRLFEGGPLIYQNQDMPLGPEEEVLRAYLDQTKINDIRGVVPALDAAFRMECWQRDEAERRRVELERQRREEEARLALEERRRQLVEQLGDGAKRREMAQVDFTEAAKSALAIGGAQYLDHRRAHRRNEIVVRFRFDGHRYECTCDNLTLRIIDAGICLTSHDTGERGDDYLTLESLPGVIRQADMEGKLVILRHMN